MKPDPRFLKQPKRFWAYVRSISEHFGYTRRGSGQISTPTLTEMKEALESLGLNSGQIIQARGEPTELGRVLTTYFESRAHVLNNVVEPLLMDATEARAVFTGLRRKLKPKCPLPMNKQKGKKRALAYFTGLVNMLIESHCEGFACDYEPRQLTTITRDGAPLRTLARWVDGAFPQAVNPIAVWEIKEYYYTTTFGSRVADGVYETLLDGMELEELREHERVHVSHYLMVDSHYTWWECGKSYLCRIIDMLHMGYVDEVLFGKEVLERMPPLVKEWVRLARLRRD